MAKLNTKIVMLKGEHGEDGTTIKSIDKSASSGLVDTYTITLTNGSKFSFNVTNGKWITSIDKTSTSGLVDTYTIQFNDGTASTFTVTNGEGVQNLQIGGRNLLLNSASYNDTEVPLGDTSIDTQKINVIPGENITVSFDVKSETPQTNKRTVAIIYFGTNDEIVKIVWVNGNVKTEYTRLSLTDTVPNDAVALTIGLRSKDEVINTYSRINIERGNIATDWTPAPEDLTDTPISNSDIDTILNS